MLPTTGISPAAAAADAVREPRLGFSTAQIVSWADAHYSASGRWPTSSSGPILFGPPGVTWLQVERALHYGGRGLAGGSSLAQLLDQQRAQWRPHQTPLSEANILAWADRFHERLGRWPVHRDGPIPDTEGERWRTVNDALRHGCRGLPGGTTLARFLAQHRGVRSRSSAPRFTEEQILVWAEAHHERTGSWPHRKSGPIADSPGDTWCSVHAALRCGGRGLPGGLTLTRLLAQRKGVRRGASKTDKRRLRTANGPIAALMPDPSDMPPPRRCLSRSHSAPQRQLEMTRSYRYSNCPPLSIQQLLAWVDEHHERTGKWPYVRSGLVVGTLREKWFNIDMALRSGRRGLPGGSSLAHLLEEHRGVRNRYRPPRLSEAQIVSWADAHHRRTGKWPNWKSGPIPEAPGETWQTVERALAKGRRGLPGGSSVARTLAKHRGVRNHLALPRLTVREILFWADVHQERTGKWPTAESGQIPEAPAETWYKVNVALGNGGRGLPGGSSLARLLAERRGARNRMRLPRLTERQILAWADAHRARTRTWPLSSSGPVVGAFGETWSAIQSALSKGKRGLPGGSSLAQLLAEQRGVRNRLHRPRLSLKQILLWADGHYRRTGQWPKRTSGPILFADAETWNTVDSSLNRGSRGLPGGSSLAQLLAEHRGVRNRAHLPPLPLTQILGWADAHHERTGKWPNAGSGEIPGASGQTWKGVQMALHNGRRGLPRGSSLSRVLRTQRRMVTPKSPAESQTVSTVAIVGQQGG